MSKIAVSIICLTYNQEQYIKDALDGFLKQKTDFPFEILVHDDASTDGTAEILKDYQKRNPKMIRLILQEENKYSKGIDITKECALPYAKGKYVAICEGDDYWIYERKLQEQYELMETHPEVSACYHNALIYQDKTDMLRLNIQNHPSGYIEDKDVIYASKGWYPTASFFGRRDYMEGQPDIKAATGDLAMRTYMACRGKLYFVNRAWSVYRDFSSHSWNEAYGKDKRIAAKYIVDTVNYFREFDLYSDGRFSEHFYKAYMAAVRRFFRIYYEKGYSVEQFRHGLNELKMMSDHQVDSIIDQFHDEYIIRSCDYYEHTIKHKLQNLEQGKEELYIYGAGVEALKAMASLTDGSLSLKGLIVSRKTEAKNTLLGYPIYSIGEVRFHGKEYVWPCLIDGREDVLKILKETCGCKLII